MSLVAESEHAGPAPVTPATAGSFRPRRPVEWVAMVVALVFLAGVVGYVAGSRRDAAPGAGSVDVGFLQDMLIHHEQALELSGLELANGSEPAIQSFAREVLLFQSYEIGLMERRLAEWGYPREQRPPTAMAWMDHPVPVGEMPGLASAAEMDRLRDLAGREADALFVPLMQDHHRGGVHMAEYAAEHASDPFVRDLAGRMARNQRVEVAELEAARARTGLDPQPVGWVPAEIPDQHDHR